MGKVGSGADEENGVAIDEASNAGDVDLVGGGRAGDEMDFDFEIRAGFAESGVSGFG